MSIQTALTKSEQGLKSIPGDSGFPLVGHTFSTIRNPVRWGLRRYKRFGEISWARAYGIKLVNLVGPDANQFLLQNKGDVFSNNQGWDFFIGKFFTRGIMLLDFEEHRQHRRIMQAAFKKNALVEYLKEMNPGIERGVSEWKPGQKFFMFTALKQLTLDLATEVFMGDELGREVNKVNKAFVDTVRAGTSLIRYPLPGTRWKRGIDGRKVLERFFFSKLESRKNSNGRDLFSQLCRAETEDGERFSDQDVVNHMIFLMMAAHDTTTITLSTMFYHLAKNPDWQDRLRRESIALGKEHLDYEDLATLSGLTKVMKESLRLCAPVPSLPRKTVEDTEFKGVFIPKGSMINISPYITHYMSEYWPNPYKFDPDRFDESRREDKVHPYAWVPFGGGAHMCIGLHFAELQVKAVLHQVLLKYRWSVDQGYKMPIDTTSLPVPADRLPVNMRRV